MAFFDFKRFTSNVDCESDEFVMVTRIGHALTEFTKTKVDKSRADAATTTG